MADHDRAPWWTVRATVVWLALVGLLVATPTASSLASTTSATARAGSLAAAPVHPADEVRDAAEEVLSRREYQPARRGLLQRLREEARAWFAQRLATLFDGSRGSIFAWSVVVLGVAGAGFGLWRLFRRTSRDPGAAPDVVVAPEERTPEEWWDDAARAQGRGELEDAVRAGYHAVIATLATEGVVDGSDGSTIGEHRRDVHRSAPGLAPSFDRVAVRVEDVLYGSATASPDDLVRLRSVLTDRSVVGT